MKIYIYVTGMSNGKPVYMVNNFSFGVPAEWVLVDEIEYNVNDKESHKLIAEDIISEEMTKDKKIAELEATIAMLQKESEDGSDSVNQVL